MHAPERRQPQSCLGDTTLAPRHCARNATATGDRRAAGEVSKRSQPIGHAVGGAKVGTCAASDAAGQCRSRQSSKLEGRARPWLGTPDCGVIRALPCAESPPRRLFSRTMPKPSFEARERVRVSAFSLRVAGRWYAAFLAFAICFREP